MLVPILGILNDSFETNPNGVRPQLKSMAAMDTTTIHMFPPNIPLPPRLLCGRDVTWISFLPCFKHWGTKYIVNKWGINGQHHLWMPVRWDDPLMVWEIWQSRNAQLAPLINHTESQVYVSPHCDKRRDTRLGMWFPRDCSGGEKDCVAHGLPKAFNDLLLQTSPSQR